MMKFEQSKDFGIASCLAGRQALLSVPARPLLAHGAGGPARPLLAHGAGGPARRSIS